MSLVELEGATYGPVAGRVAREQVAAFVDATGDDPARWDDHAPPGYAAALLFRVAPRFLEDPRVVDHTTVLIHVDQSFEWVAPLAVDSPVDVSATVTRVRERAETSFVTFTADAQVSGTPLVRSVSTFLLGTGDLRSEAGGERTEPAATVRAPEASGAPPSWDRRSAGDGLPVVTRSASRADLVRYAAASGDFNPIHWDHEAAVVAGLPGIVVHGLLMLSWMAQSAAAPAAGGHPLASMKGRFRAPLHPAEAAEVSGRSSADDPNRLDLALTRADTPLVTGTAVLRDG